MSFSQELYIKCERNRELNRIIYQIKKANGKIKLKGRKKKTDEDTQAQDKAIVERLVEKVLDQDVKIESLE